ncbi:MFS transporter [Mesosutterella sp. AGMB02718]|uniref:MFS transporter n=1 Tax=Mesosutterella faecium TaxID=2925194 RepID=A0ABT7IMK1_9BURK|nr:MFS transporter [Mesosutterella sp. AGMB02718]MDL2059600.1 MFS transporter [Mesosutterella sp. AGMB02718]
MTENTNPEERFPMNWKVLLGILTITAMMMSASYTMLVPFLPLYLTQELGVSDHVNLWSGAIFSVTFVFSAIMAPIWGAMSDRGSRKMMAIRSAVLLALTYTLGGLVQTPFQLFLVRVLQGFAAGLWPALLSLMSSNCPQRKIGFAMGIMQGALTAGHVIGPLAGGVLAQYLGMRFSFFTGGAALFTITLVILFAVREKPRDRKAAPASIPLSGPRRSSLFKIPVISALLVAAALTQTSITVSMPIFTYYVGELLGTTDHLVAISGYVFAVLGIAGVIASPIWGWVGQSIGFKPVLLVSMLGAGIFAIVSALPGVLEPFVLLRFIGGLAFAGIFPAINAMLTRYSPVTDRGRVFGVSFSVQQAGSIVGPLLGGAVASFMTLQSVMIFSGIVQLAAFTHIWLVRSRFSKPEAEQTLGVPRN